MPAAKAMSSNDLALRGSNPVDLLRLAARAVELARAQLNADKVTCSSCGRWHAEDQAQLDAFNQLENYPYKMRRIAEALER